MYRLSADLQLGIEYNPFAGDLGPLANWRAVRETMHRPAVIFGTSSDRIGTPRGRAYYVTFAKDLQPLLGVPVAPYVGLLYSEFDREFLVPVGATIRLGERWSLLPTFDGHAFHPMIGYARGRHSFTAILVRGRDPGLAVTAGF